MAKQTRLFYFLIATLFSQIAYAQELLSIPTQNHCLFSGTWEDELYRFDNNPKVQEWVNDIVKAGGITQNFELVQASVENVAAVFDATTKKRYVFYSQNFIEKANRLEVYAALAHEIGHHAHQHSLTDERRGVEEGEADQFMGYVLAKIQGISSLGEAQKIVDILPTTHPFWKANDRREAIKLGWLRAEQSLKIDVGEWEEDPNRNAFLKAQFPFPPPPCCSPREIPRSSFISATKLGDIANKLCAALEKQGYTYRTFLSVPNGFALVTQMEQYNADYTCRMDASRWSNTPIGASFVGYLDYFKRLVMPSKAYYRTFVFIVTTDAFSQQGTNVSKNEASAWYGRGINRLPKTVAEVLYTEGVTVTALVYEFVVPESNRKPNQKCPNVETQLHLEKSGLWLALR